uniref:Protein phosphatase 1 regulatory subunit 14D n=1 Tax=Coturnix japonica TaxID=93934 RepID=A0A8C2SLW3_COTJA
MAAPPPAGPGPNSTPGPRVCFAPEPEGTDNGSIGPEEGTGNRRGGKVTVRYDRRELRKRLHLEEWILAQLTALYDCRTPKSPLFTPKLTPNPPFSPQKETPKPPFFTQKMTQNPPFSTQKLIPKPHFSPHRAPKSPFFTPKRDPKIPTFHPKKSPRIPLFHPKNEPQNSPF